MKSATRTTSRRRLLAFNCHEPWVYQLGALGYDLDIIVDLPGKHNKGWDEHVRPVPAHARLMTLQQALDSPEDYYCLIAHNTTDLLDIRLRPEPRLLVLHHALEGRRRGESFGANPQDLKQMLRGHIEAVGGHVIATSTFKGESWGSIIHDVVQFGVDVNDYAAHEGEQARGLRVCDFVNSRRDILLWSFHEQAFEGIPVTLVGHNPDLPSVQAAESWDHLKAILRSHRFYIHTADPRFEAGHNLATIEAMAAGLPVLGNRHPTSPIKHAVSGFLCDNPKQLRHYARILLDDRDLAHLMGQQAKRTVMERFSLVRFRHAFLRSIEIARRKWYMRNTDPSAGRSDLACTA